MLMQSFGGQIRCIMGDVQVAYHHGTVQPQPQINQVQTYIYEIPYVGETFDTILREEGFTSHPWTIYYP